MDMIKEKNLQTSGLLMRFTFTLILQKPFTKKIRDVIRILAIFLRVKSFRDSGKRRRKEAKAPGKL